MEGYSEHNLDAKGRLFIPAQHREELGETFYMCPGFDHCIALYPQSIWDGIQAKIREYPMSKAREIKRRLGAVAQTCTLDAQGRIIVPQSMRQYADIEKETVIVGAMDYLEIWNPASWKEKSGPIEAVMESTADLMEEFGI